MKALSVLLVEDSALFSSALTNVLGREKKFRIALCSSVTFLKSTEKFASGVVVIDTVTWASGLQALVDGIRKTAASMPVILLVREDLLEKQAEALRAGAVGLIGQTATARSLSRAIKAVAVGGVWFERRLFRKVFLQGALPMNSPSGHALSQKEQQIVTLVASGKTNKEIGSILGLNERTIKACLSSLFRKVGVPNRSSLTSYAILHGVRPLSWECSS